MSIATLTPKTLETSRVKIKQSNYWLKWRKLFGSIWLINAEAFPKLREIYDKSSSIYNAADRIIEVIDGNWQDWNLNLRRLQSSLVKNEASHWNPFSAMDEGLTYVVDEKKREITPIGAQAENSQKKQQSGWNLDQVFLLPWYWWTCSCSSHGNRTGIMVMTMAVFPFPSMQKNTVSLDVWNGWGCNNPVELRAKEVRAAEGIITPGLSRSARCVWKRSEKTQISADLMEEKRANSNLQNPVWSHLIGGMEIVAS